jgi:iron complex outermembrane recepter protein
MLVTVSLVLALLGQSGQADVTVRGFVFDPSGAAIGGATVEAVEGGTDCRTTTNPDGEFELPCAGPEQRVRVGATGFRPIVTAIGSAPLRLVLSPAAFSESVVVTATRREGETTSPVAPVSVLSDADLALAPPAPLDDALKVTPGFSLFRRTTSRAANPTTQGAGLRGLSSSGASRALVLADGVPLNDPFGGWVYWTRVPAAAVERVEVVRGGGSDLYGADALAGVVQVLTRRSGAPTARVDLDGATYSTARASVYAGAAKRGWQLTAAGEAFSTDGYTIVADDDRGPIDVPATNRYDSARVVVGYQQSPALFARVTGDVYAEHRGNGTPIQTNSTDIRQAVADFGGTSGRTSWRLTGQAGDQSYDQAFSSIAADRTGETLTSRQYVPASQHGVTAQFSWSGPIDVLMGADTRDVQATNRERSYTPAGTVRALTIMSGFQRTSGAYVQATIRPASRLTVVAGARGDVRQRSRGDGWLDGDSQLSPRVSAVWSLSQLASVRGSVGWAFRAPTLNERYRGFRVGNVLTLPNPDLVPESLRTFEGGILLTPSRAAIRLTVFRNDLDDPVTNVTLTTAPPLITRMRQNVGGIDAWGTELEGEWHWRPTLTVTGSSTFTHSRFTDYEPLDGLTVPQVPTWQTSVGVRGIAPARIAFALQLRAFGRQFDDDRNTLVLRAGSVVDATALRSVGRRATIYASVENLFDVDYDVGRSPVRTIGQPITVHGGVRLVFGR